MQHYNTLLGHKNMPSVWRCFEAIWGRDDLKCGYCYQNTKEHCVYILSVWLASYHCFSFNYKISSMSSVIHCYFSKTTNLTDIPRKTRGGSISDPPPGAYYGVQRRWMRQYEYLFWLFTLRFKFYMRNDSLWNC